MRLMKRIAGLLAAAVIISIFFPSEAHAAVDMEITSVVAVPDTIAAEGGEIIVEITVKNTGTFVITHQELSFFLSTPSPVFHYYENIVVGDSKTFTEHIKFDAADLDRDVALSFGCASVMGTSTKTAAVRVNSEENVIRSGGAVEPEKDIYYVGETVYVTDSMRNSLSIKVTDMSMDYYFRRSGGTDAGDTVDFDTVDGGERVENTLEYTFTEEDLGGLRIGSSVTYKVSGKGPYTEYNVAHDFVVEPAPTPTPSPTPTATTEPTPEATNSPAPSKETVSAPIEESAQTQEIAGTQEAGEDEEGVQRLPLSDRGVLIALIIVIGAVLVLLIVLIIVIVARKK